MSYELFRRYAPLIASLPDYSPLSRSDLLTPTFRREHHELGHDRELDIYYVPFELINAQARVMVVGITPGWTQMECSYEVARNGLRAGLATDAVLRGVEDTASFAGQMRKNLVCMLDGIGLATALGIQPSTDVLFSSRSDLLHSTSVVRFPVFVNGENYTGSSPSIARSPVLGPYIFGRFRKEVQTVRRALIIPLGARVTDALQLLVQAGEVDASRCLLGFPHPSPANGHMKAQYEERRDSMRFAVEAWYRDHPVASA